MNKPLEQIFDINILKIGQMVNSGILQIGCGGAKSPRVEPVGYTTVGTALVSVPGPPGYVPQPGAAQYAPLPSPTEIVPLPGPTQFAVPLQAPVQ